MNSTHLSDDDLLAGLLDICLDGRRLDARLIVHLIEVEDRRLHLKLACSSLFDFCVRHLHMSEGAAFRRINAARLARRFSSLVAHIESGALHLSTLVLLRDHLTDANVDELVGTVAGKTKREVEELLARRAPRPDVPSKLRKLPARAAAGAAAAARAPQAEISASPMSHGHTTASSVSPPAPAPAPRPARLEPLAEARYKLQLTLSAELRDKLEHAQDLMRHRNPSGDLAVVVERALDALLEKLEKERLGKTDRPRRTRHTTRQRRVPTAVPTAVRREVFARDGEQCTFVDEQGRRCPSHAFLELDHRKPRALGGADDAANLRVLCRAHNLFHAEEVFGQEHVAVRAHFRRRKSEAGGASASRRDVVRRFARESP